MMKRNLIKLIIMGLLLAVLTVGVVSAGDNITQDGEILVASDSVNESLDISAADSVDESFGSSAVDFLMILLKVHQRTC